MKLSIHAVELLAGIRRMADGRRELE